MPNTQNLATVGVTNRQDTDNIIVEQGGNIRRVQYEDIKTGILKGDAADGTISTFEESAEEFPIPAPATPQKTLWGRIKKFCSDFNDWKTGVMLFGHLVNNAESDSDTLPLAASVAKLLQEQITTNTSAITQLNSDLKVTQEFLFNTPTEYLSDKNTHDRTMAYRSGNTITLIFNMKALKALTPFTTYLILPEKYRPTYTLFFPTIESDGQGIRVGSDGAVMVCKAENAGASISTTISYVKS